MRLSTTVGVPVTTAIVDAAEGACDDLEAGARLLDHETRQVVLQGGHLNFESLRR